MNPSPVRGRRPREIVVVGAGVIGSAVARELTVRGARVTVVDRAAGVGGGCSYANAAVLAPDHVGPLATAALLREAPRQMLRRPPAVRLAASLDLRWSAALVASARPSRAAPAGAALRHLAHESLRLHQALAAQGLHPTLRRTGTVDVSLRPARRRPGADRLDGAGLRLVEPALSPAVVTGAHHPDEWVAESRSFVTSLLDDAARRGAEVRYGVDVRGLVVAHGAITGVETGAGRIAAEHVVIASGLEADALSRRVGVRLPLRGGRGYGVDVAPFPGAPTMPVRLTDHRVVVTPLPDRVRVCGAIEFGDEHRPADLRRADALLAVAGRVVPGLERAEVLDRWSGERPCSSDGAPAIGTSARCPTLSVAVGHGMWGSILAPVTARIVADQLVEPTGSAGPHPLLDPDRFSGARGR